MIHNVEKNQGAAISEHCHRFSVACVKVCADTSTNNRLPVAAKGSYKHRLALMEFCIFPWAADRPEEQVLQPHYT